LKPIKSKRERQKKIRAGQPYDGQPAGRCKIHAEANEFTSQKSQMGMCGFLPHRRR